VIAVALALAGAFVIPVKPTTWVTDAAGLLSPKVHIALEQRLRAYRNERGPDVVVWIAKDLPDEPRHIWCPVVFDAWGIGSKSRSDGVALFIFANGPKYCWIRTGWGVMQALPDAEAVRICREVVAPAVKAGRGEEGILAAVEAILAPLDKSPSGPVTADGGS
jgi:uncharacterized protein